MLDPHDDTDVPSGTTDGAQMESTSPPVLRLQTAEIRRLCALEFRLLETAGLDGHSLQRYI